MRAVSRGVPIALPLPEGFSVRQALACGRLVEAAYGLYQQWSDAGKPAPEAMRFALPALGDLVFEEPFWRTLTYRTARASGGKGGDPNGKVGDIARDVTGKLTGIFNKFRS